MSLSLRSQALLRPASPPKSLFRCGAPSNNATSPCPSSLPPQPYKYLGIWITATLDWSFQLTSLETVVRTKLITLRAATKRCLTVREARTYLTSAIWGAVAYSFAVTPVLWSRLTAWDDAAASLAPRRARGWSWCGCGWGGAFVRHLGGARANAHAGGRERERRPVGQRDAQPHAAARHRAREIDLADEVVAAPLEVLVEKSTPYDSDSSV